MDDLDALALIYSRLLGRTSPTEKHTNTLDMLEEIINHETIKLYNETFPATETNNEA